MRKDELGPERIRIIAHSRNILRFQNGRCRQDACDRSALTTTRYNQQFSLSNLGFERHLYQPLQSDCDED